MVIALSLDVGAPLLASTWSNSWMTLTVAERLPLVLCCCIGFDPAPTSAENITNCKNFFAGATGQSCSKSRCPGPVVAIILISDIWTNAIYLIPVGSPHSLPGSPQISLRLTVFFLAALHIRNLDYFFASMISTTLATFDSRVSYSTFWIIGIHIYICHNYLTCCIRNYSRLTR